MLLIRELSEQIENLVEDNDGKKSHYIVGPFLQAELKNKNGRFYPAPVMESAATKYIETKIKGDRAWGELGHPASPSINLPLVSHRIVDLQREGNNWIGKALITEGTPNGKIVIGLMESGGKLGVSSRGMGSLKPVNGLMEVQDDYNLSTAGDVVSDPSAPDAFVKGILEGVEWFYDAVSDNWRQQERLHETVKQIKRMRMDELERAKLSIFESFVQGVAKRR